MTYPYGTKGAPVVGNGLGGLPRRAVAGAAASVTGVPDGALFTEDSATKVTLYSVTGTSFQQLSFNDPNGVSSLTRVSADRFLVPFYYSTDSGTYATLLKSIQATSAGITVSSGTHTIGDNNTRNFRCNPGAGFMSGDNYVQLFCPDGTAASVNVVSLSRSQISSSFTPPTSDTVASGSYAGQSYSSTANVTNYMYNSGGAGPAIIDNGDGTGTLIRKAVVSSTPVLMAFVYNASATLVDTHVLAFYSGSSTTNTVGFAYYEDISGDRRVICSVIQGSNNSGAIFVTTFNKANKTLSSFSRTYSQSSYSLLGSIFVQSSRTSLTINLTGYGNAQQSLRCTCFLDATRTPTTTGTDGSMKIEFASGISKWPSTGLPVVASDGSVYSVGAGIPSYSQAANAIDPLQVFFADPNNQTPAPFPLVTKYLEYSVLSAAGYKEFVASQYMATCYVQRNQSDSVAGDYSVELAGNQSQITERVYLARTSGYVNSGNYLRELGFTLLKATS